MLIDGYSYSDMHKDCYGFRPSQSTWERLKTMSEDEIRSEMDRMQISICRQIDEDRIAQLQATRDVFQRVREGAAQHGVDLFTYLRWMVQAELPNGDIRHEQDWSGVVGYEWGLSYRLADRLYRLAMKREH